MSDSLIQQLYQTPGLNFCFCTNNSLYGKHKTAKWNVAFCCRSLSEQTAFMSALFENALLLLKIDESESFPNKLINLWYSEANSQLACEYLANIWNVAKKERKMQIRRIPATGLEWINQPMLALI